MWLFSLSLWLSQSCFTIKWCAVHLNWTHIAEAKWKMWWKGFDIKKTTRHQMTSHPGTEWVLLHCVKTTGSLMERSPIITRCGALRNVSVWSVYASVYVIHIHLYWSYLRGVRWRHRKTQTHPKQTLTCIYTQVAGQVHRAPLSCHPLLEDLLFSRCSKRLLLMNYAAVGPCNKLQADSTPCVWLKI